MRRCGSRGRAPEPMNRTSSTSKRREDVRFRVMRLLEQQPHLTQREIANELGISLGGVNYCLRALVDKGFVKIQNFKGNRNKIGYAYLLTPQGIYEKSKLTADFLVRKMKEYEALKAEIDELSEEVQQMEMVDSDGS